LTGGKLLSRAVLLSEGKMIKKFKKLIPPTDEELKLADTIRKLYETHNVTIFRSGIKGWRVSVKKKESKDER
jgi:hypothetical protein